jgi:tyrosinase
MTLGIRRNIATMTGGYAWQQKAAFFNAVMSLKGKQQDSTNLYDMYVSEHRDAAFAGHRGPAFFAWHRQFLKSFEDALRSVSGNQLLSLPYWDWSINQSDPSWPFTQEFLGGNGQEANNWQVTNGMFAYNTGRWNLNVRTNLEPPYLRRQFGPSQKPPLSLPTFPDVQTTLDQTLYDTGPFWDMRSNSGFRNIAEGWIGPGMHNLVHLWVGGSMLPMTSPNDPVFWLHHCFIDKLWADWQARHKKEAGYQPYLPSAGANLGHNLNDEMAFDVPNMVGKTVRPADVLDHRKLGYCYDTEDYLLPGEELYPEQWIYSAARQCALNVESVTSGIGRAVLAVGGNIAWSAPPKPPWGPAGCRLKLRLDGDLVLYDPAKGENNPLWDSKTANHNPPVDRLEVFDWGQVALMPSGGGTPIWTGP